MTTSPSLIQVFFFIEPGILPIRTTPSMQRSLNRFAPRRLSTVARISLSSLRGVRTLVTVSSVSGLALDVGLFKSASAIPRYLSFIMLFIFRLLLSLYIFFRALRLFVPQLSTCCYYFNAAFFFPLLLISFPYYFPSFTPGDNYIYQLCLCMSSRTKQARTALE